MVPRMSKMVNSLKWLHLSILSLASVVFGLVHQKLVTSGGWFNWEQFLHHESLIAMAFVGFIVLLVVYLAEKRGGGKSIAGL